MQCVACRGRPRSSNWSLPGAAPQLGRLVNIKIQNTNYKNTITNYSYYTTNTHDTSVLFFFFLFFHRDINRVSVRASHVHRHDVDASDSIPAIHHFSFLPFGSLSVRLRGYIRVLLLNEHVISHYCRMNAQPQAQCSLARKENPSCDHVCYVMSHQASSRPSPC